MVFGALTVGPWGWNSGQGPWHLSACEEISPLANTLQNPAKQYSSQRPWASASQPQVRQAILFRRSHLRPLAASSSTKEAPKEEGIQKNQQRSKRHNKMFRLVGTKNILAPRPKPFSATSVRSSCKQAVITNSSRDRPKPTRSDKERQGALPLDTKISSHNLQDNT